MTGTAIKTHSTGVRANGIGQKTAAHLNLTRTLADVWAADDVRKARRRAYAGHDPHEIKLRRHKW